jgi:chorismate synthase
MSANSFGSRFVVTTFGESHGPAMGVIIDGCPAGLDWQDHIIRENLLRRRPGSQSVVSGRGEMDDYEILSGVFENRTLGTPICLIVRNKDTRSQDYDSIKNQPRAGHADDVWKNKFLHSDHRGGGRASGRETVTRVLAGSVAQMLCGRLVPALQVRARIVEIGGEVVTPSAGNSVLPTEMIQKLEKAKEIGESFGGVIEVKLTDAPAGLGQPVFHKLKADLTSALMSIGAVTGVELGAGATSSQQKGTDFHSDPTSSRYGGIRGGLSTGEPIIFRVHLKPTSSILDVAKKGRHDPFIGIRALPVVESMIYLVLADHLLWIRTDRLWGPSSK